MSIAIPANGLYAEWFGLVRPGFVAALARRLAIALWRYVEHGEIPAGVTLKTIDV